MHTESVLQLVRAHRSGHSLERSFYCDPRVYQLEVDAIWRRSWLFVGHSCQINEPGEYFTLQVGDDPLIVMRDDTGRAHAFHNVCRHRGTLLCQQESGRVGRLVCPYHQWAYARDGALVSCWGMQEDIDRSELGLRRVHLREVAGILFVCLADEPPDFTIAAAEFAAAARPQGIDRAKVAKIVDYAIDANWKLVWENNRECYHCNANHPQYIKANFDHYNSDDASERIRERLAAVVARSEAAWNACSSAPAHKSVGMYRFPDPDHGRWWAANRTPLVEGYVSETMTGQQAAPLMGDYTTADVGTLRMRAVPSFWNHSSCDHAVSTRILPLGIGRTQARVIWLVDRDAIEGRDYRLEDLMPFWQLTSEQDWDLCRAAQIGVRSSGYVPGPLSTHKEYGVDGFDRWCLQQLQQYIEVAE